MRIYKVFTLLGLFISIFYNCSLPADDEEDSEGEDTATSELSWEGETDKFTINSKEGVHLNDPAEDSGTAYVTIPSTSVIGGAKDNVTLYRQNGDQPKLLASGREVMKGNNSPQLYIKVECDNNGYWTFWTRLESEDGYTLEKQVKDTGIQSSVCSGIYCVYTKTRCKAFTFHHVRLSNGVETTTDPDNTPDKPDSEEPDITELPEDVRGMLLFNEIMYDNATDGAEYIELYNPTEQTIVLPQLFLYKMHEDGKVYSTTTLQNESPSQPLIIASKGYLCFSKYLDKIIQKHNVNRENLIEISKFPALDNEGGYLALSSTPKTGKGHTFDTCRFWDEMHDTDKSKTIGISLEKKSPELPSLNKNWRSSKHTTGGTPGIKNM